MFLLSEEERERLWKETRSLQEIYVKGQMDFVKWTVAISTGAIALSMNALDALKGQLGLLIPFAIGLVLLLFSILFAVVFMNLWLHTGFLYHQVGSLLLQYLSLSSLPQDLRDRAQRGKTETELTRIYNQFKAKEEEIDLVQRKYIEYFRFHVATFMLGFDTLVVTLVLSAIWQ